jgi:hypothetical protein
MVKVFRKTMPRPSDGTSRRLNMVIMRPRIIWVGGTKMVKEFRRIIRRPSNGISRRLYGVMLLLRITWV